MKKFFVSILFFSSILLASSIENGIGVYADLGLSKQHQHSPNNTSNVNYSYGVGITVYNVNEYKVYYGCKMGGEFGKVKFDKSYNYRDLKIQAELGYRILPQQKVDLYGILGYKRFIVANEFNYATNRYDNTIAYKGFGIGIGIAKTYDELFRGFADFTYYGNMKDKSNKLDDTRLTVGIILKD